MDIESVNRETVDISTGEEKEVFRVGRLLYANLVLVAYEDLVQYYKKLRSLTDISTYHRLEAYKSAEFFQDMLESKGKSFLYLNIAKKAMLLWNRIQQLEAIVREKPKILAAKYPKGKRLIRELVEQ